MVWRIGSKPRRGPLRAGGRRGLRPDPVQPPFFRGAPRSRIDLAWHGTDVLERFAAGLPAALAPGDLTLLLLSTDGDGPALLGALERGGFAIESAARRDYGNEVVTVHAVRRAG
jgi:hypothetical protein